MRDESVVLFNPRELVLRAAKRLDLRTVVIVQPDAPPPPAELVDLLISHPWLTDLDAILEQLVPLADSCRAAFGFGEIGCFAAAVANERFGWPGNSSASVRAFTDKSALRAAVEGQAGRAVRHRTCSAPAKLLDAVEQVGYPCIVKPVDGTGSAGVRYLADSSDCHAYLAGLAEPGALLVEEFLQGTEVSVEAMSSDGSHRLLAVTAKLTTGQPYFVELGHTMPLHLGQVEAEQLWNAVDATLTAAGHRYGVSHTEFMLTADGPRLIESHGRPGGDRISDLIGLALGVDVFDQTIAFTLGLKPTATAPVRRTAAIRYLNFDPAEVMPAIDLAAVRALPYVHEASVTVRPGQRPPSIRRSSDRHGFVVATGADAKDVHTRLDHATGLIYEQARPEP